MDNKELRKLLADDDYAASFQSMGQYRQVLIGVIDELSTTPPAPVNLEAEPSLIDQVNADLEAHPLDRNPAVLVMAFDRVRQLEARNAALSPSAQPQQEPIAYLQMWHTEDMEGRDDGFEVCEKHSEGAFPVYPTPQPHIAPEAIVQSGICTVCANSTWADYYTGPVRTHVICTTCDHKKLAPKLLSAEAIVRAALDYKGMAQIMREASDILSGEKEMRLPIVDELDGFAYMLDDANDPQAVANIIKAAEVVK